MDVGRRLAVKRDSKVDIGSEEVFPYNNVDQDSIYIQGCSLEGILEEVLRRVFSSCRIVPCSTVCRRFVWLSKALGTCISNIPSRRIGNSTVCIIDSNGSSKGKPHKGADDQSKQATSYSWQHHALQVITSFIRLKYSSHGRNVEFCRGFCVRCQCRRVEPRAAAVDSNVDA